MDIKSVQLNMNTESNFKMENEQISHLRQKNY